MTCKFLQIQLYFPDLQYHSVIFSIVAVLLSLTKCDNNLHKQVHHTASCRQNKRASSQSDGLALHHADIVGDVHAPLVTNKVTARVTE